MLIISAQIESNFLCFSSADSVKSSSGSKAIESKKSVNKTILKAI